MATYDITVFSANKYLFKTYLLSQMMQQKNSTIKRMIEKLTLKLIDLKSTLIHNQKTHTDYTIKSIETKNAELIKQIFLIISKSTEPDKFEEIELANLHSQIKAFHFLAKGSQECKKQSENKQKSYLNGVFSYFQNKLWYRKKQEDDKVKSEEKEGKEEKKEDSNEKLKPFFLKLIESISLNLIKQLNIVEYNHNNDLKFEDPKRILHIYNRILRIEDVLKKQTETDQDSFFSQILAKNSFGNLTKRNHQSDSSSSSLSSSLESIINFKKPRIDSFELDLNSNSYKNGSEMHFMPISKLPGVGKTYAQRLTDKNIKTFGDLIELFEVKCRKNEEQFENKLRDLAVIRGNSAKKITQLIMDYLNKTE